MDEEYCDPCDRWFRDDHAYTQHINNHPAHALLECNYCYKQFQYENGRQNHQNAVHLRFECHFCTDRFLSESQRDEHHRTAGHPWCDPCKRVFNNQNNLLQHLHSSTHVGKSSMECPFCKLGFATASGVVIHLESNRCKSGMNKAKIDAMIQKLDRQNVITRPMLEMPGYSNQEVIATERTWNGDGYECYLCHREFTKLTGLNMHIKSPVHQQSIYKCPKLSCARPYKSLSGLVMHVESESCGVMRFNAVQQQARHGIQNMVGRMISS